MNRSDTAKPLFSVILTFRNESKFLEECLKSFDEQTISRDRWEIILVDGCSDDGSRQIAEDYVRKYENAKLLDNPKKVATAGWNVGVREAIGKYFHIANGHSVTDGNFLSRAEGILKANTDIHALGGRIFKIGLNDISAGISAAMNTPFAMGGSYYRIGTEEKRVNVIGQGIYWKELTGRLGLYDDSLGRSGDWEFNYRICANGYNMLFDPKLVVRVFSRAGFRSSFIQMFRTGFWKVRIWAKHPASLLPRHIIPSIFVLWLLSIPFSFLFLSKPLITIWLCPLILYFAATLLNAKKAMVEDVKWYLVLPAFPIIHVAYGSGFLVGLFRWWKSFLPWIKRDK